MKRRKEIRYFTKHKRRQMQEIRDKTPIRQHRKQTEIWQVIPFLISNYFKCKWIKLSNQKTEIGKMDRNTASNCMLPVRDAPGVQRRCRPRVKGGRRHSTQRGVSRAGRLHWCQTNWIWNKKYTRQRRALYIKKRLTEQENIAIINIYTPNDRSSKHISQNWQNGRKGAL